MDNRNRTQAKINLARDIIRLKRATFKLALNGLRGNVTSGSSGGGGGGLNYNGEYTITSSYGNVIAAKIITNNTSSDTSTDTSGSIDEGTFKLVYFVDFVGHDLYLDDEGQVVIHSTDDLDHMVIENMRCDGASKKIYYNGKEVKLRTKLTVYNDGVVDGFSLDYINDIYFVKI